MNSRCILNLAIYILIASCSSWRSSLKGEGNLQDAVNNSIIDYLNTSNLNRQFNTYDVTIIPHEKVIGISINGNSTKWRIGNVKVGEKRKYFPSKYEVVKGKLFYWSDSTVAVSTEMLDIMREFDILDTITYPKNYIPDEDGLYSEGAVDYYFCKSNYLKYKKIYSKIAMGYYEPPRLKCDGKQ